MKHSLMRAALIGLTLFISPGITWAQWSIGNTDTLRMAPAGQHHFVYFVFSNPIPGQGEAYNEWYQQFHMGDLIQTPQVTGGQRFRLVTELNPRPKPTDQGVHFGYLAAWDNVEVLPNTVPETMRKAIQGGRTRNPPLIYEELGAVYQAVAPRVTRPDGGHPTVIKPEDFKTPRPFRYMVLDFSDPVGGDDATFAAEQDAHIRAVLGVPGWLAAQRFQAANMPGQAQTLPRFLTIYETEGITAKAVKGAFDAASSSGQVKALSVNPATAQFVFWQPISPYVTKADFQR